GPAGTTAALLLASWGHAVDLVTKRSADHGLAVSLPPSCAKLFDAIGVTGAIERAGFVRSTGNTVWWGSEDARVETFAAGSLGWQLDVSRLAAVLLDRALAAGVRGRDASSDPLATPGEHLLIDCTGRHGVLARQKNLREYDADVRTVALVGEWRRDGKWPVPDDTHTLIESYDDGWMWSVPTASGVRHIAAMIDPRRSALAKGELAADIYLAEIAKTRIFKNLIGDAFLHDGPRGWDASQYRAREYAGEGWLLAGDAGSFIDPLSSAGVKKALASGWLAAIVTHTCLVSPAMRSQALEFFSAREREIEQHLFRESRRFLAGASASHQRPFWDERSDEDIAAADEREVVQRAFEHLKSGETLRATIGPGVTIEPRPCVRGREIVIEPHVVAPDYPRGVRYIHGIDLIVLVDLAPVAQTVPDLFDACVKRLGSMSLHDFLLTLATAVARGWLVAE
ncbi:MAG: tryptophan 7-halogenase, partial [Vicinamibacterales bacterium]